MLTIYTYFLIFLVIVMTAASFRRPGITAGLMWSMFALEQLLQQGNDFLLYRTSLVNVSLTAIAGVMVMYAFWNGKFHNFVLPREAVAMALILVLAAVSYYWAISQKDTLEQLTLTWPYIVAFAILTPLCTMDDRETRAAINTTVWFGGLVLLGHAVSNYGYRGVILDSFRGKDIEANPLAVATYAGYVGICALFASYGQRLNPLGLVRLAILLLAGYMIIRSGSRGQLVGLAAVCMVWLPITTRATVKRSTIVAIIMAIGLVALGIWVIEKYEWSGRWDWDKIREARTGRWEMCADLLEYWGKSDAMRWLFGLGNSASFRVVGFYPHNTPAEVLAEEGIVGMAIFAYFCLSVGFRGLLMMYDEKLPVLSRSNLGVLLALFSYEFILGLKQGSLLGSYNFFCFGCTTAILMARYRWELKLQGARQAHPRPVPMHPASMRPPGMMPGRLPGRPGQQGAR